uniref:Uncharacterized protein n=1 Tax=Rhizophora mucronata TaxID=61149 RepID=A0A2P2QTH5_RHIMU
MSGNPFESAESCQDIVITLLRPNL